MDSLQVRQPQQGATYEFAAPVALAEADGDEPRRFEGVAYSGGLIESYFDRPLIFDLKGLELPDRLPMLVQHDRAMRAGWADKFSVKNATGLHVSGQLMQTHAGGQVADEADMGFPWQLSVHVQASDVSEVPAGQKVRVNGKSHAGPLIVFNAAKVREASFTPTGADSDTHAFVFSAAGPEPSGHSTGERQPTEDRDMEMAELQAQLDAEKAETKRMGEALAAMQQQHESFVTQQRTRSVSELFAAVGIEHEKDEDMAAAMKPYLAMSDESFHAAATTMRALADRKASSEANDKGDDKPTPGLPEWLKNDKATSGVKDEEGEARASALFGAVDKLTGRENAGVIS